MNVYPEPGEGGGATDTFLPGASSKDIAALENLRFDGTSHLLTDPLDILTPTEKEFVLDAAKDIDIPTISEKHETTPRYVNKRLSEAYHRLGITCRADLGAIVFEERTADETDISGLTARQREVFALLGIGLNYKAIAIQIGVTHIWKHTHDIQERLGLKGRVDLRRRAHIAVLRQKIGDVAMTVQSQTTEALEGMNQGEKPYQRVTDQLILSGVLAQILGDPMSKELMKVVIENEIRVWRTQQAEAEHSA